MLDDEVTSLMQIYCIRDIVMNFFFLNQLLTFTVQN